MSDANPRRPALSPPAEGLGHTDLMISPEAIDVFLATGDHPLITPTPSPVDWQRVGPKLVEALEAIKAGGSWQGDTASDALAAAQSGAGE